MGDYLGISNTPMCDFNTWYQNYYPLYAKAYNAQTQAVTNTATTPSFQGNQVTTQQAPETEKKKSGGKVAAVISAAALIGTGIACYRKGNGKGVIEKIKNGFNKYKASIRPCKVTKKNIVETLPENVTPRAGTFTHNDNTFSFVGNRITGYTNSAGENLLGKFSNPTVEADKAYADSIKKALAEISQGKAVEGYAVTPTSYALKGNKTSQLYSLIAEGENKGKYQLHEVERGWAWPF